MPALQSGGQLVIKPTPKQRGGFLGTLLASIWVPILLKALIGGNRQNRCYIAHRAFRIPRVKAPRVPSTTKKSGTRMQNRPYTDLLLPYNPPPFYGS